MAREKVSLSVEVVGRGEVWSGLVVEIPREGEHVEVDETSLGHVAAVLWSFREVGSPRVTVRVR